MSKPRDRSQVAPPSLPRSPYPSSSPFSIRQARSLQNLELEASDGNQIIKTHHPITTPQSETFVSEPLLHSVSSTFFDLGAVLVFDVKPLLIETAPDELPALFVRKCIQGTQMCDFHNQVQVEVKQAKQDMLNDILNAVSAPKIVALLGEGEYREFYHFVQANVVRAIQRPPRQWLSPSCTDFSLDRVEESGWAHLSLVYDCLCAFVNNRKFDETLCPDEVVALIHGVIPLFQSADQREREKMTKVARVIYRNFPQFRRDVRFATAMMFNGFVELKIPPVGCWECLMALIPVIQGLKVPLHEDNMWFFRHVLLPLHRVSNMSVFHAVLVEAIRTFLGKDPTRVKEVLEYMERHWPKTSATKEVLFLSEIETLSELVIPEQAQDCVALICKMICLAVGDPAFQVAERALVLWESDSFMKLITANSKIAFPVILPVIFKTAVGHWCSDVRTLALNAMRVLKGCDVETFDEVGRKFNQYEGQKLATEMQNGTTWVELADTFGSAGQRADVRKSVASLYLGCEAMATEAPKKEVTSTPTIDTSKKPARVAKMAASPRPASKYRPRSDRLNKYRASMGPIKRKK